MLAIAGHSMLSIIVQRAQKSGLPVVVATSDESSDDAVASHCAELGVPCFRGSLDDVAHRFVEAGAKYGWDYATRINGDNLFVDPELLRELAAVAETDAYDLVTNVPGRTYPPGASIEIVNVKFFAELSRVFREPRHREHVTLYMYENPECCRQYLRENPDRETMAGVNLAIDTPADYEQAQCITRCLPAPITDRSLQEIVRAAQMCSSMPSISQVDA